MTALFKAAGWLAEFGYNLVTGADTRDHDTKLRHADRDARRKAGFVAERKASEEAAYARKGLTLSQEIVERSRVDRRIKQFDQGYNL